MTDTILFNGRITTLDPSNPTARAVAIDKGSFAAVGDEREIMTRRGTGTLLIDLRGRATVPGLFTSYHRG